MGGGHLTKLYREYGEKEYYCTLLILHFKCQNLHENSNFDVTKKPYSCSSITTMSYFTI